MNDSAKTWSAINMQHKIVVDPKKQLNGWTVSEAVREKLSIMGVDIFVSGMQATHPVMGEIVGAAGNAGSHPDNRAWFELLERITILETIHRAPKSLVLRHPETVAEMGLIPFKTLFPDQGGSSTFPYQFAKSNGVALSRDWRDACRRAAFELLERHLVLLSWAGKLKPRFLTASFSQSVLNSFSENYEIKRVSFGSQRTDLFAEPIHSCGSFLIPKKNNVPFIFGLGADISEDIALTKAESETVQRLGFLWGEEIPKETPPYSPTAMYHQEYYLHPEALNLITSWLEGRHLKKADLYDTSRVLKLSFADLNSPSSGVFQVARAYSPDTIPLVFGRWKENIFKDLDDKLLIHPVA